MFRNIVYILWYITSELVRTENGADHVVSINGAERQPPPRATGGQVDEVQEHETSSTLPQIFTSHLSAKIKHETLKKIKTS